MATVLVADENVLARADVRDGLTRAGFRVSEASGAAEAVSKLKRRHFDCVVAGASSAEILLAAIPSLRDRAETPVIVVADRYDAEMAMREASSGAIDRLTRPVSLAGLIAAVARAMDSSVDELHARRIMLARSAEVHASLARLVATARVGGR